MKARSRTREKKRIMEEKRDKEKKIKGKKTKVNGRWVERKKDIDERDERERMVMKVEYREGR